MNLQGRDRLRKLLLGAVAAGVFGSDPTGFAAGPGPAPAETLAAASGKKSEVMRQLELLYQQDGREMPDLNTDIKPVPTSGVPAGTAPAGATSAAAPAASAATPAAAPVARPAPRTQMAPTAPAAPSGLRTQQPVPTAGAPVAPPANPEAAPPKSKYPVVSFFKRLLPGSKEKEPKASKAPAEYRPDVAPVPPAGLVSQPAIPVRRDDRIPTVDSTSPMPLLDSQPRTPFGVVAEVPSTLPLPLTEIPPSPEGNVPVAETPTGLLPPLLAEPTATATAPLAAAPAVESDPTDETPSPFSEMSEAEADKKNPFTGLTLEEEAAPVSAPPIAAARPQADANVPADAAAPNTAPAAEDPFADELEKMGVLPPAAEVSTEKPPVVEPKSDTPDFVGIEDQATREKMKKIHERGGMKGLKGFCPVTLRDQRELVDAKPEFHSSYRGQKFHFADAEAKLKFDENPSQYAPAAYGADVVALTRDKDVVEGSLDFAAWFKGRLYLFGSEEAHDTFVGDPSKYATPAGIE